MSLKRPAKEQPENFEFNSSSLDNANKIIAIKENIQKSLMTLGAEVDSTDDSFMYEGSKYYISISKAEE